MLTGSSGQVQPRPLPSQKIMSAAIWYPFFKAADNQAVAEEKAGAVAEQSEE